MSMRFRTGLVDLTEERASVLNIENKPDKDGCVRGAVLGAGQAQSFISKVVAVVTLYTFIAWPYIMLALTCASTFY